MRDYSHSLGITAPPAAVLDAFFDHEALSRWWNVRRSLCVPRPLGSYAIEWDPTEWQDDVLGRLGGTFRGTVIEFRPGREFFVADAFWLPPDGEPLGPMALEARCTAFGERSVLTVRQSGGEESARWARYYDILGTGFTLALDELKSYLEKRWS